MIGCSAARTPTRIPALPWLPHFSMEQAKPWMDAGVIALNSHSYDMHQVAELDGENCRSGVLPLAGESEQDYIEALKADYTASWEGCLRLVPEDAVRVFTYPYGKYTEISEIVLNDMGVTVTVTTNPGMAEVVRGLPQSMRVLEPLCHDGGCHRAAIARHAAIESCSLIIRRIERMNVSWKKKRSLRFCRKKPRRVEPDLRYRADEKRAGQFAVCA